jgi:bifunctional UDP-N-acetylglucosamine pyrophosphorylase/glucosamine-1-phosphate N-acetyltransferase
MPIIRRMNKTDAPVLDGIAIAILAAGKGTRMQSALPKVMHLLGGIPLISHVLATAEALNPVRIVVVVGPGMDRVSSAVAPHTSVLQQIQRGTGDAVATSLPALGSATDLLVLYGDTPLIRPDTLRLLVEERRRSGAAVAVLGMNVAAPNAYGRLVLDADGDLERIVEAAEAGPEVLAIRLCNSGVMAIDGAAAAGMIDRLLNFDRPGEVYLTDLVEIARREGRIARVVEAPHDELAGVNSRADLAAAEAVLQHRLRAAALDGGATLIDPGSVYLAADTRLGRDVTIGPNVVFGPGVTVEDGVTIRAFCHLEGVAIRRDAIIGPFARLRPGSEVGERAHVGNFVELKNTHLAADAKANHLTYLGDASVGARANIGAGTITCNYDGFGKYRTEIGADVFIGSNAALVAPVSIGEGAMIAAGSVITNDVAADATAIARGIQVEKPGHARRFRAARRRDGKAG